MSGIKEEISLPYPFLNENRYLQVTIAQFQILTEISVKISRRDGFF